MSHCQPCRQWMADLASLPLRFFIAFEFFEAGLSKLNGQNWFAHIQDNFPFPFHLFSPDVNWYLAMGGELLFPVLLVLGLFTRFSLLGLTVITLVAWVSVHHGGYAFSNGGYKFIVIFLVMFVTLFFQGPGRLSLDHLLRKTRLARFL